MLLVSWIAFSLVSQVPAPAPATSLVSIDAADAKFVAQCWRPIFQGVDQIDLVAKSPRALRGSAVRIDLKAPGIRFFAAPSNGEKPGECDSLKTSTFLKRHHLQVAINCAPFHPVLNEEEKAQDVIGLAISEGKLVSPSEEKFAALLISKDNRASIVKQTALLDIKNVENACGGFDLLIQNGKIVGTSGALHPRSAAGITKDERYLLLLVIDGRQKGYSLGASLEETAQWLEKLGAWHGLNLDGGGSTSLVTAAADGSLKQINRPIHLGKPGTERPCPNHLGIHAAPLKP